MNISHGARWGVIIIGLLGLQIVMSVSAAILATSDSSNAIVENYHQTALDWDEHKRQQLASQQLGWVGRLNLADAKPGERREVQFTLRSREGEPITGARVQAEFFHHARGNDVIRMSCAEKIDQPGVYVSGTPMSRAGLWQFHVEATRGSDRFLHDERIELPATSKDN